MEITQVREYRTSDMALVTYLKMSGHACQRVEWEGRTCHWYFFATDSLLKEVDIFMDGLARIEPREYSRVYQTTKREFYDSDISTDEHNRIR